MQSILKTLEERANPDTNEKWILCHQNFPKYDENGVSNHNHNHNYYYGFSLHNVYKGNFEAAFLEIRKKMLKNNYIDILINQLDAFNENEIKTLNECKKIEKIKHNFCSVLSNLYMRKFFDNKPCNLIVTPFKHFCNKERQKVEKNNPDLDEDKIMDILIQKWDEAL
jgi:hypothetical protein